MKYDANAFWMNLQVENPIRLTIPLLTWLVTRAFCDFAGFSDFSSWAVRKLYGSLD
jgi:hypothetical protein